MHRRRGEEVRRRRSISSVSNVQDNAVAAAKFTTDYDMPFRSIQRPKRRDRERQTAPRLAGDAVLRRRQVSCPSCKQGPIKEKELLDKIDGR